MPNKGKQLHRGNTIQNRPIQFQKEISEIDGGVFVTRVYESNRISVNKGKKTKEQPTQIEKPIFIPFTSESNIPGFIQNI